MDHALFELAFPRAVSHEDSWDSGTASSCAAFIFNEYDGYVFIG
jgi:hypothetical protein